MSRKRSKAARRRRGGGQSARTPRSPERTAPQPPDRTPGRETQPPVREQAGHAPAITERDGVLYLEGELNLATSAGVYRAMKSRLAGEGPLVVDMDGVTRADSSGLALMLEWVEEAGRRGRSIRFRAVPEALRNIARFSNVSDLVPAER